MLKNIIKKLYDRYDWPADPCPHDRVVTVAGLVHEIRNLLPQERLQLQIKAFRFPEAKPLTEMQELVALRSLLDAEPFLNYLENRKYNLLTAHIEEITPEGRLQIKGRYLEVSELFEGIKTSKERSEEKAIDEAINNIEEHT